MHGIGLKISEIGICFGIRPEGASCGRIPGFRFLLAEVSQEVCNLRGRGVEAMAIGGEIAALAALLAAPILANQGFEFFVGVADGFQELVAARAGQQNVPAGRVNPLFGQLLFLADRDAASVWRSA